MRTRQPVTLAILLGLLNACTQAQAQSTSYDKSFLRNYDRLQTRTAGGITDALYLAPDIGPKLKNYSSVAVDQPEVLISPQSDYRGAKPDDLAQVAEHLRVALTGRLTAGGYTVAPTTGPGVLYIRLALTDLELKKKRRNLLAYTPVGAVVKIGADAVRSMLDKYDITGMTLQGELLDSTGNEVLAALVTPWPGGKPRMEFVDLDKLVSEYGERLRCNLDNARGPADQNVDCLDRQRKDGKP